MSVATPAPKDAAPIPIVAGKPAPPVAMAILTPTALAARTAREPSPAAVSFTTIA